MVGSVIVVIFLLAIVALKSSKLSFILFGIALSIFLLFLFKLAGLVLLFIIGALVWFCSNA